MAIFGQFNFISLGAHFAGRAKNLSKVPCHVAFLITSLQHAWFMWIIALVLDMNTSLCTLLEPFAEDLSTGGHYPTERALAVRFERLKSLPAAVDLALRVFLR